MTDNNAELILCKETPWHYHVDIYFKNRNSAAPMMIFIRKDQYEMWKVMIACGSTEDMIVLKDYIDQDVVLRRYDILCAY